MRGSHVGRLAGSVRWSVVPFAPAPPFRLYAGTHTEPIVVQDTDAIIEAAHRGGDAELSYIVPGKARPVLLLTEPTAHHREITGLRLLRLSKLSHAERQRVQEQQDELLFNLAPDRFVLPEESAVMVSALVRVNVEAIGSGPALGHMLDDEMRVLGERIIRFYGFDVRGLLEGYIRELADRHRARS